MDAHFYFCNIIEQLTAVSSNGLQAYHLTHEGWEIASDVQEVLPVCFIYYSRLKSKYFFHFTSFLVTLQKSFQLQKLLVVDIILSLETLCEGLIATRDDEENNPANVVQVACHAAVLFVDKYSAFSVACDIYILTMAKNLA